MKKSKKPAKKEDLNKEEEKTADTVKLTVSEVVDEPVSEPKTEPETVEKEEIVSPVAEENVSVVEEVPVVSVTKEEEENSVIDQIFSETPPSESPKIEEPVEEKPVPVKEEIFFDKKPAPKKSFFKIFLTFLLGFLLGGVLMAGVFYLFVSPGVLKTEKQTSDLSPTPVAEVSPQPTEPVEEIDSSLYKVQVLNGSGVKGAAAGVQTLIESLGFNSIKTGNASVTDQKETTIQFKAKVPAEFLNKLEELLPKYTVTKGEELAETEDYDIVITVGLEKE